MSREELDPILDSGEISGAELDQISAGASTGNALGAGAVPLQTAPGSSASQGIGLNLVSGAKLIDTLTNNGEPSSNSSRSASASFGLGPAGSS